MCKIKFEAEDGTIFDTQEACKAYEDIPKIYVVRNFNSLTDRIVKVFLSYNDAKNWKIETQADGYYNILKIETHVLESFSPTIVKPDKTIPIKKTTFNRLKELVCGKG